MTDKTATESRLQGTQRQTKRGAGVEVPPCPGEGQCDLALGRGGAGGILVYMIYAGLCGVFVSVHRLSLTAVGGATL